MRIDPRNVVQRFLSVSLAAVALAGAALPAAAQRAPELLPAQVTLVAGGGSALVNGKCPQSGITPTDTYGDGCLASEIILGTGAAAPGPRYVVADANGNVFFTDYANNLIRRVDATTGIITAVAGQGASTPGTGTVCGTAISVDSLGDGCLGSAVKLSLHPMGIAFAPNGDLYFSESDFSTSATGGGAHVRKIAATGGLITTTGTITLVLGQATAKGYAADVSTTCTATVSTGCITAANSYLYSPYQLSTDATGNLFIAEEYTENAVLVYNPTAALETINNVVVPAGTVAKLIGAATGPVQDCPNAPASTNGCTYGKTTFGAQAAVSIEDGIYGAAPDSLGNLYAAGEYYEFVGKDAANGVFTDFAGIQATVNKGNLARATAGVNAIGSTFGIATDLNNNVYFTDASNGVVWRVDADTSTQYVVAGGATATCTAATDTYGDGCPATQTKFGTSGTTFASATIPGPGIYGVSADKYGNLFTGDTETNLIREVGTGAQFGPIGSTKPTNTLIVHYAPGDSPASSTPYVISAGANNFALGTIGTCVTNADTSKDCPVGVQATPGANGAFTGALTVTSAANKTATFPLSGILVVSRTTRTSVALSAGVTCTGSNYSSTATLTLTATITSSGSPTGQVQFYNNLTTPIGSPVTVSTSGTAVLSQAFPKGSYSITAVYSGDTNFNPSTSSTPVVFTTSPSSYTLKYSVITPATGTTPNCTSTAAGEACTVPVGGTATYSFTMAETLYSGTVSFSCAGLPSGATCIFSPKTLVGTGCSTTPATSTSVGTEPVVAMTVTTSQTQQFAKQSPAQAGFSGRWMMLGATLFGLMLAFTRRRMSNRFAQVSIALFLLAASAGLVACNSSSIGNPSTPKGTSTIIVTASGSDGSVQSLPVTLTIQ